MQSTAIAAVLFKGIIKGRILSKFPENLNTSEGQNLCTPKSQ